MKNKKEIIKKIESGDYNIKPLSTADEGGYQYAECWIDDIRYTFVFSVNYGVIEHTLYSEKGK